MGNWVTPQARNVIGDIVDEGITVKFLVRDRDTKYVAAFDEVFRSEGAQILKTPLRTPNANAHAERFVRTIRSECLDHLLVVNALHLERILRSYVIHYNRHRPHEGISQETPHRCLPCSCQSADAKIPITVANITTFAVMTDSVGSSTSMSLRRDTRNRVSGHYEVRRMTDSKNQSRHD
jgi:hypothetical protein